MIDHKTPHIAIIAALDEQNGIGRSGGLLCHLPGDLKHFKELTTGHSIIMGRKTYESLPKGALPNRTNIVITSNSADNYPGCIVVRSVDEALAHCKDEETAFIIGGGKLYRSTLYFADKLYITRIHHTFDDADTFFPEIDLDKWTLIRSEARKADEKHLHDYSFLTYVKRRGCKMDANGWQEFLQGDETAFSEIYCSYFNELFAYGLKIGFGEEICKDAIQDIFYKIYISRNQLTHIRNIEFYLLQCMKNKLFDIHNGEAKIDHINYDDIIMENENSVVEKIIEKETQSQLEDRIKQSLKVLSPKQRKIIYYHYQLNLSFNEIATLLEMKPEAVKKSIHRALQKMRENQQLKNPFFTFSLCPF